MIQFQQFCGCEATEHNLRLSSSGTVEGRCLCGGRASCIPRQVVHTLPGSESIPSVVRHQLGYKVGVDQAAKDDHVVDGASETIATRETCTHEDGGRISSCDLGDQKKH